VPVTVPLTALTVSPNEVGANAQTPRRNDAHLKLVVTDPTTGISPPDFADVSATHPGQLFQLSVSDRTAYATYEVLKSDSNAVHEAIIGAHVAFISNTGQNLPELASQRFGQDLRRGPTFS
jgi:hypothetical protein